PPLVTMFAFYWQHDKPDLPSFPTRRSSDLTPCGSFGPKRGRCQIAGQVRGWNLIKIGNFPRLLTDMTNTPYASMAFVSVWMGGGQFVMGNDFVIPIRYIQSTVRSKFYIYGPKPIIF